MASSAEQPLRGLSVGWRQSSPSFAATLELAIEYGVLHSGAGQGKNCCFSLFAKWVRPVAHAVRQRPPVQRQFACKKHCEREWLICLSSVTSAQQMPSSDFAASR
jgi:hypothetical protein